MSPSNTHSRSSSLVQSSTRTSPAPASKSEKMTPTIHFVRHAEGFHNISIFNHGLRDPLLTPYGKEQCAHLAKTFPHLQDIDLVVASPLKRTIYTALLSFGDAIDKKNMTIIALPEIQETSNLPCDTGSSREDIAKEFEGVRLDLSRVPDDWTSKTGKWAPHSDALEERCKLARKWLRSRPERNIVVVTHGGVLHYLTEDWSDSDRFTGTGWANTEFRSYTFDPSSGDEASLVETAESRMRRKGTEKPLSEAEQRNLKISTQSGWEKDGYTTPPKEKIPSKV